MYKVPFRQVYCESFLGWIQETIWCHVIMKVFKSDLDALRTKDGGLPIVGGN